MQKYLKKAVSSVSLQPGLFFFLSFLFPLPLHAVKKTPTTPRKWLYEIEAHIHFSSGFMEPLLLGPLSAAQREEGEKKGLWPTQVLIATTAAAAKALVSLINMSEE